MSDEKRNLPESVVSWILQHAVTTYVMTLADPKHTGDRHLRSRILDRKKMHNHLALMVKVRRGLARALQEHPPELSEEDDAAVKKFLTEEQAFLAEVERDPTMHEHVWGEICKLCDVPPDVGQIELDKKLELLQAQGFGRVTLLPDGVGAVSSTYPDLKRKTDIN